MRSFGQGDPRIPEPAQRAHARAVQAGRETYRDPLTGYQVLTAPRLLEAGRCCGNGCRHCPFTASEQRDAGRETVRPAPA